MGYMESIKTAKLSEPPRIVLVGTEGVGKSTFAAASVATAPCVAVDTEDGMGQIDCPRFPVARTWADVVGAVKELRSGAHKYRTLIIDSLDWAEKLCWDAVCADHGVTSIEKAAGGYGKGYGEAAAKFRALLADIEILRRERRMMAILIAHAKIEKFEDPLEGPYDRYSPRLHKAVASLVTEWADAVLFACRKMAVVNVRGSDSVAKSVGQTVGGDRILRCEGGPACVAKNRYGLPAELPLVWAELAARLFPAKSGNGNGHNKEEAGNG